MLLGARAPSLWSWRARERARKLSIMSPRKSSRPYLQPGTEHAGPRARSVYIAYFVFLDARAWRVWRGPVGPGGYPLDAVCVFPRRGHVALDGCAPPESARLGRRRGDRRPRGGGVRPCGPPRANNFESGCGRALRRLSGTQQHECVGGGIGDQYRHRRHAVGGRHRRARGVGALSPRPSRGPLLPAVGD